MHRRSLQRPESGVAVSHQGVDQHLPGLSVVPVTGRLTHADVVVVAHERRPHPGSELGHVVVERPEQLADRSPELGHGVLGSD